MVLALRLLYESTNGSAWLRNLAAVAVFCFVYERAGGILPSDSLLQLRKGPGRQLDLRTRRAVR